MLRYDRLAHVLAAMMIYTPVFAGAFDVTTIDLASNTNGDLSAIITQANTAYKTAAGGPIFTQDVALISQTSDANVAVIDQDSSGGTGDFAAIVQSGAAPSIAYIHQSGTGNMAVIKQH